MDTEKLFEQFLQAGLYLRGWSPRTAPIYRRAFASFRRTIPDADRSTANSGATLSKSELEAWVCAMRQRGMSPAGCNIYIRAMNAFSSWLREQGRLAEPIALKQIRTPHRHLVVFSEAEMRTILRHRPTRFNQVRLWTLMNLMVDTGLRIDEALSLRSRSIDFDNLLLRVVGKGNRERLIPFSIELRKVLVSFLHRKRQRGLPDEYIFCTRSGLRMGYRNVYRDIKVLCDRLGIRGEHVRPHCFRHFFAVNYLKNGGDLYSLSRVLGHTSIKTTELYLRSMGAEQLAAVHRRVSPLSNLNRLR